MVVGNGYAISLQYTVYNADPGWAAAKPGPRWECGGNSFLLVTRK